MRLTDDLTSKWLLHLKGFLFLIVGLMAAGTLLFLDQNIRTLFLLLITIWAFCRFYYYLFYVLEKYIGRDQKYAGIFDALKYIAKSGFGKR